MDVITTRQATTIRRQIRKLYRKSFIPVHSQDTNISIGDVMLTRNKEAVVLDGTEIPEEYRKTTSGKQLSRDIVTGSLRSFSTEVTGASIGVRKLKAVETGLKLGFQNASQMALLLRRTSRTRLANFPLFKQHILERYTRADLAGSAYIVDEVLYADQFFLQFGGEKGGELGLVLDLPAAEYSPSASAKANILYAFQKNTGFSIDGSQGGVLAYRVSKIKLLRDRLPKRYLDRLPVEQGEAETLDSLSADDRKAIANDEGFGFVDRTDAFIIEQEENHSVV